MILLSHDLYTFIALPYSKVRLRASYYDDRIDYKHGTKYDTKYDNKYGIMFGTCVGTVFDAIHGGT